MPASVAPAGGVDLDSAVRARIERIAREDPRGHDDGTLYERIIAEVERPLIEAMLVETPVVATASGGNVEAIRDRETGRLVPPEDAQALADACATLLRDPAMMEGIGQSARADALLKFGEARHADAIMAIYDDMLHAGAGQETPHR